MTLETQLGSVWAPRLLSVLRIMAALLFMAHGTTKMLGFPGSSNPGPELFSLMGLAGTLELVGGAFLALGLFTRPVAFVLSGQMAVAYFMAHAPASFFPIVNRGESAVLFCFCLLLSRGGGRGPVERRRGAQARLN